MKLYVYNKSDGSYLYEDVGNINTVLEDLGASKDFTLTPTPDAEHTYYWIDDKWVRGV